MFIFTAKFNKKKALLAVLVLAAILIAVILIAGSADRSAAKETAALSAVVKNNDQRVKYLNSLGWEVDKAPVEEQKVVIPREFPEVYKKYNELQLSQGFDLSKYGGIEATRYTYKVLNYPKATGNVVADIIIYRDEVIAGDVQSNALDGFMAGLEFPKSLTMNTPKPSAASPTAANPSAALPTAANPSAASPTAANPSAASPTTTKPNAASPTAANPSAAKTGALTSDGMSSEEMEP